MKKILLSCACCLLALGLVTACEDEVIDDGGVEAGGDEALYFGFESAGVLYVADGDTLEYQGSKTTYEGSYTSTLSEGVEVSVEEGSGSAYYISYELGGTTYWITTAVNGTHHNLDYSTTKSPVYLHTTTAGGEYFGDESGEYFFCQNSAYECLYLSDVASWLNSSPVCGVYTASGELLLGGIGSEPDPVVTEEEKDIYEVGESGDESYPVSLHYSHIFEKDDKGTDTAETTTTHELNGLTWTVGYAPYWGFDTNASYERGLQIGSGSAPATSGVDFTTDFGTTVKLVSLSVNVAVASHDGAGAGTVTTSLDNNTLQTINLAASDGTSTSATDYEAELTSEVTGQVLGINFTASDGALYIKSVEFTVYMPAETAQA